jgi:hypothetical protein
MTDQDAENGKVGGAVRTVSVIIFALVASLAAPAPTPAIAATSNCISMQYHVELARHALVEADVYDDENNRDMMKISVGIAEHEMRVAEHLGEPAKCLSASQFLAYLAAGYHLRAVQYGHLDIYPEGILSADTSAQKILKLVKRSTNPDAYDELKKYAGVLHGLVSAAQSMVATKKEQDDDCRIRGENVCRVVLSCKVDKASKKAAPDGYLYWEDVLFFDAQVDVDATGKPIQVRVSSVEGLRETIDRKAFGQRLLAAKFSPGAMLGTDGKCTPIGGTVVFERGRPVEQ